MKHITFLFIISVCASMMIYAQPCESYYPAETGTKWEITNYNARGKVESVEKSQVLSNSQIEGGTETTISSKIFDDKGKETSSQTFTTQCKNGVFYLDMKTMLSGDAMNSGDAEIMVESSNMEMPANLTVGQKLADAWIKVSFQASEMPTMFSQTVNITNRKVEGFETITTPAGTFNCVKISFDVDMKMLFSVKMTSHVWYSVGVGTVRTENFDKRGKPQGHSELTAFSK
jgi:hypothetical protein